MEKTIKTIITLCFCLVFLAFVIAFIISLYYLGIVSGKLCQCSCKDELAQFGGLEDDLWGNITIRCKCIGKSLLLNASHNIGS